MSCVAPLNNNKTVSSGSSDGVYGREHCDGYIGCESVSLANVLGEQLCYPVLSSNSAGLTSCYDRSPQSASLTYLQQVITLMCVISGFGFTFHCFTASSKVITSTNPL